MGLQCKFVEDQSHCCLGLQGTFGDAKISMAWCKCGSFFLRGSGSNCIIFIHIAGQYRMMERQVSILACLPGDLLASPQEELARMRLLGGSVNDLDNALNTLVDGNAGLLKVKGPGTAVAHFGLNKSKRRSPQLATQIRSWLLLAMNVPRVDGKRRQPRLCDGNGLGVPMLQNLGRAVDGVGKRNCVPSHVRKISE